MLKEILEPVDCFGIQDTFCTAIARIDTLRGGCLRFVLVSEQGAEQVVVAKIVVPVELLEPMIRQASFALAEAAVAAGKTFPLVM